MPHIFHMAFAENNDSRDLRSATWGLPLYLLLLSLPVLPVTWAGIKLGHDLPMDYSGLAIGMAMRSVPVSAAAFIAGLSAASATIIVTTLALANMCLNHLVLPLRTLQVDRAQSIYTQLKWLRRTLIAVLILAGYLFFVTLSGTQSLSQLALVAFTRHPAIPAGDHRHALLDRRQPERTAGWPLRRPGDLVFLYAAAAGRRSSPAPAY